MCLARLTISKIRCLICTIVHSLLAPLAKEKTCLTKEEARVAFSSIMVNNWGWVIWSDLRLSSWADPKIGVNILFKSWAIPQAKVPMLSSLWVRKNCSSSCFLSVMSVSTIKIDFGCPSPSNMSVQRLSTVTCSPDFLYLCNTPCQLPDLTTAFRAITSCFIAVFWENKSLRCLPIASSLVQPYILRAPWFQNNISVWKSLTKIASVAISSRAACS